LFVHGSIVSLFSTNFKRIVFARQCLKKALSESISRPVTLTRTDSSVISGDFIGSECGITYLANTSTAESSVSLRFSDGYTGDVTVYYPLTGNAETVAVGDGLTVSVASYEAVLILRQNTADHRKSHTEQDAETETATETETDVPVSPDTESAAATEKETEAATASSDTGCSSAIDGVFALISAPLCVGTTLGTRLIRKKQLFCK
jgi:hypothetical protein